MSLETGAVYENGVLKLEHPVALENGQRVRVTIHPTGSRVSQSYGLMQWKGDPKLIAHAALVPEFGIQESP